MEMCRSIRCLSYRARAGLYFQAGKVKRKGWWGGDMIYHFSIKDMVS